MSIYITGDKHGNKDKFLYNDSLFERVATYGDTLIVCGDFGYIFDDSPKEYAFLNVFINKPYITCFIDGNHENFDVLNSYVVEKYCGGYAHIIKCDMDGNPKLIHLMRGQIYEIENHKLFTFGGATSVDKDYRVPGISWWEAEMPTDEEYEDAFHNLELNNYEVDYIITHTAPDKIANLFSKDISGEKRLNDFLQRIDELTTYKHYYFGHFHDDRDLDSKHTVLFNEIRNIETNMEICETDVNKETFIFDRLNYELEKFKSRIVNNEITGIYIVVGERGSGKTTFLKSIYEADKMEWINKECIKKQVRSHIMYSTNYNNEHLSVILIDDIDEHVVSISSYIAVNEMLDTFKGDSKGNNRLIILTATNLQIASQFVGCEKINIETISVTKENILKKAESWGIILNDEQLNEISKCETICDVDRMLNKK